MLGLPPGGSGLSGLAERGAPDAAAVRALAEEARALSARVDELAGTLAAPVTRLDVFHGYMGVFVVAFLVALFATPLMRKLAIRHGVVDRPNEARKIHRVPIAYLGGVAVYLGILGGILFAYTAPLHQLVFDPRTPDEAGLNAVVPISILLGMTVVMICGLVDDVVGLSPRLKIAGMLFAAAALATEDVGVKVAAGLLVPIAKGLGIPVTALGGGMETILLHVPVGGGSAVAIDVVYWTGTAVIAVFVLGACNASNLIDGLDGLLSGTTAITAVGLLIVALGLAISQQADGTLGDGPLDAPRIVLCLALLGACLGFLPHNFNPATIFLGDTGSLMLGYITIAIVLTLGDTGKTHLVLAGLIIYALPIMDTTLAIVRRKMSGKRISDADDQHLHHMFKRALGVKGAALMLYGIAGAFAVLGVALSEGRQRVTYALVLIVASFIGVIAMKIGRREHIERQMREAEERRQAELAAKAATPAAPGAAALAGSGEKAGAAVGG
jgi:UDP-GlcNAc:undecaprenyl-phosphate GlcNAc-1-phosphate transferase